jgi:hypothetical protein
MITTKGRLAQLVAREIPNLKVGGSSPSVVILLLFFLFPQCISGLRGVAHCLLSSIHTPYPLLTSLPSLMFNA